jgi:UDP-glucuronate 4-epimerase
MHLLVTGGAGFIGSNLVDKLLEKGHQVSVVDDFNSYYNASFKRQNVTSALKNSRYFLFEGDITNLPFIEKLFAEHKFDMVIHLAARAGVRASLKDPFLYQRVNVEGTLNILESAKKYGVKKITFGSTSSVYGINSKIPFSESDPVLNAVSPYAATKIAGEALCRSYSHLFKMDIAVLRFFSVYGPRGRPDMAIYQFSEKMLMDEPIPFFGDGSSQRDYTYVDDIVQGVIATTQKEFGFDLFNLGESETTELRTVISLLEESIGKKAKIDRLPEQPGDVPRTFADIDKARRILGYNPQTKVASGIPKFVSWFLKNRTPATV